MVLNFQGANSGATTVPGAHGPATRAAEARQAAVPAPAMAHRAARADPIAEFFARAAEDRYRGWDAVADVAHWLSVAVGGAFMAAAALGWF
ncbi:hypothetical protein [Variovorax ginsengisoli]|uniref:Uncharacterized protein n=1 Tax=Variovorax ginsengisoli TaxID=363844 RepID=A0ABT8S8I9_9BURK|nr:hypothetical protein [Variovorax ginsengisoli]MDN8614566.1 hypothetical protein [Variovorax ginsengisoli]MDO1533736.1 hypothetical protein [Variovorax ginsengisoli]